MNAIVALEPVVREAVLVVVPAVARAVAPEGAIGGLVPVVVPAQGVQGVTAIDVAVESPSQIGVGAALMRPARPPGVVWPVVEQDVWSVRSRRTARSGAIGRRNTRPAPDARSRNGRIDFATRRPRQWLAVGSRAVRGRARG